MRKGILIFLLLSLGAAGCITNNYYGCEHHNACHSDKKQVMQTGEPIVSPDKIGSVNQDADAPQYPNIKPWYTPPK